MTNADQPGPVRLLAAEVLLRPTRATRTAIDVLRGLARQPNREIALTIARRSPDLPRGGPRAAARTGVAPNSKAAAEVGPAGARVGERRPRRACPGDRRPAAGDPARNRPAPVSTDRHPRTRPCRRGSASVLIAARSVSRLVSRVELKAAAANGFRSSRLWPASHSPDGHPDRHGRVRVPRVGRRVLPARHHAARHAAVLRPALPGRRNQLAFYRPPTPRAGREDGAADRPPGSRFTLKVPKSVSHDRSTGRSARVQARGRPPARPRASCSV